MVLTRIKTIFICLAFLLNANAVFAGQQPTTFKDLAGTYIIGFEFGGEAVLLNADGTFTREGRDCTTASTDYGKYSISNDVLHFTISKATWKRNGASNELDLFDPKQRKLAFGDDSGEIEKEFDLKLVRWMDRMYLMSDGSMDAFTEAINLGVEPRPVLIPRQFYGLFFLRDGDENKTVSGKPNLPKESLARLLGAPVAATIVSIDERGPNQIATIDKGSADGLRTNMEMVISDRLSFNLSRFKVISVEKYSAKLEIRGELKVGDKLSSKYERDFSFWSF